MIKEIHILDKAKLLGAGSAYKLGEIEIPELGGKVFLRVISSRERDQLESEISAGSKSGNLSNIRAKLVVRSLSDEAGKRIFSDADVELVGDMPAPLVGILFDACARHNGMTGGAVEDARKN